MSASLLLKRKFTDEQGDLFHFVVWAVPRTQLYRDGVRYRLAFIPQGLETPAVLYDNHHPKGHHKHLENLEQPYLFTSVDKLLTDFEIDVRAWKQTRGMGL
jgi:hypothetical protein